MVQATRRRLTAALVLLWALPAGAQRLVLVSFDGLGAETFFEDPVAAELTVLKAAAQRGAASLGVQPAFPSTTANSHAALWTGCYGDVNGISANSPPVLPRAEHAATERGNGFRAEQLAAETFWVAAARAGITAVAHQPTQGYPFTRFNSAPGAVVVNGYQTRLLAPHALWTPAAGRRMPDGSYLFEHGPATFRVVIRKGSVRISHTASGRTVEAGFAPAEKDPPRHRALARHFSPPLPVDAPAPAALYFRLFELGKESFRLYVTPWHELGSSVPLEGIFREAGGFIGNGPTALLDKGLLTAPEYLEAMELVIRQLTRHAAWLEKRFRPRLMQSYLPFPDEIDHMWLPAARAGDPQAQAWRRWGYIAVDRGAQEFSRLAGKGDYLLWVSDHGMAPVSKFVSVPAALRRSGLDGKAVYLYHSILVNTADWKQGVVPLPERAAVVEQARRALAAVPGITAFFTPDQDGPLYGIGGPAGGDLYFDFAPGHGPAGRAQAEVIAEGPARGMHGFLPTRRDMQAILVMTGPRIAAGSTLPQIRIIDIAPMIAQLLGFPAPPTFRGRPPVLPSVVRTDSASARPAAPARAAAARR
ncbi:MAG: alkaline phosphatase family protein [Bryobacteraceae bacterium]|nr:alkaline phosphatase family protein [Bryobacteraceae bacterium]